MKKETKRAERAAGLFPKHLKIGNTAYCIHFTLELNEAFSGMCYPDDKLILVSLDGEPSDIVAAFWHEVLHAIEREHKVKLGHKLINKLEWALAQVFEQLK